MGPYGCLWVFVSVYECHGYLLVSMGVFQVSGCLWVFMGVSGYLWVYGCLWVSTSVYEYLWGFMGVYGYLWVFMGF